MASHTAGHGHGDFGVETGTSIMMLRLALATLLVRVPTLRGYSIHERVGVLPQGSRRYLAPSVGAEIQAGGGFRL